MAGRGAGEQGRGFTPFPTGLDRVQAARAGEEIEGRGVPKKGQKLAGDCLETLHSSDWLQGGGRGTSPLLKAQWSL